VPGTRESASFGPHDGDHLPDEAEAEEHEADRLEEQHQREQRSVAEGRHPAADAQHDGHQPHQQPEHDQASPVPPKNCIGFSLNFR
jgi:hypothetical protein